MNEDVRSQLIRQFPVDVVETKGEMGSTYYTCPCCGRSLARGMDKCNSCEQILNWEHVNQHEVERGTKKAVIEFEVPLISNRVTAENARYHTLEKVVMTVCTNARLI